MAAEKKVIICDTAPAAIGPYSSGINAGTFIFTAGQLGVDPKSGNLVQGGIKAQTRQALTNLGAILETAGSNLAKVVKVTVFLSDISEFQQMNEVYADFFPVDPPARSAFQVAALPRGAAVEIEAIALS
ncbi:MAG: RidA family protein [Anaerolineae bacterium]|nr:RidA family protein [Anaerolineae bacterium]